MKQFALFFLLIPLIHGEFDLLLDCETSPYQLGRFCYSEYYFTVPSNYSCSTLYFTDGDTYLLSLEMLNIGASDKVTVSWDNTTVSNNGSSSLSIQQYVTNNVTISIFTGNGSQMAGTFFICPSDTRAAIPVTQVNVSYGQEAFILQQFTSPSDNFLMAPEKWEITADLQVALISAANTLHCDVPVFCMESIWVYEGIGEQARFIGTAGDFINNLYLSKGRTLTLYFVTGYLDYVALIVNEATNLEKCSSFDVAFFAVLNDTYENTLNATAGGGSCLTVLNHCYNHDQCDGVILGNAIQNENADFYVYAGAPHPDPISSKLVLESYNQQNKASLLPQSFAGNARTFYLANGSATLEFSLGSLQWNNLSNTEPVLNRQGFLMTTFYPLASSYLSSGSLDLDPVTYSYNITLTVNTTYAPPGANAYLGFYIDGITDDHRMDFDYTKNVGTPKTIQVQPGLASRIYIWGGDVPSRGSYVTFVIQQGAGTSTTTPGVPATTTVSPTDPPTTPKAAVEVYFFVVTVFSMLFSFV